MIASTAPILAAPDLQAQTNEAPQRHDRPTVAVADPHRPSALRTGGPDRNQDLLVRRLHTAPTPGHLQPPCSTPSDNPQQTAGSAVLEKKLAPAGASPILGSTERRLLNHVPRVRLGLPGPVRALQNGHEPTVICLAIGAAGAPVAGPVGEIALRLGVGDLDDMVLEPAVEYRFPERLDLVAARHNGIGGGGEGGVLGVETGPGVGVPLV